MGLNKHVSKQDIQVANKDIKDAWHHWSLGKCKSKLQMRYPLRASSKVKGLNLLICKIRQITRRPYAGMCPLSSYFGWLL